MTPHAHKVEKLFSACHQLNHFKEFKSYYFHNCPYDHLYETANMESPTSLKFLYRKYPSDTKIIILGDAAMAPYELFYQTSHFFYDSFNQENENPQLTGHQHLLQMKKKFPSSIWLNPDQKKFWSSETCHVIQKIYPMFPLTLEGIKQAVSSLLSSSL